MSHKVNVRGSGDAIKLSAMEPNIATRIKIAALKEQMDGIHFVNSLYSERGKAVTSKVRAEFQRRQDRLEQIRSELAQLRSA